MPKKILDSKTKIGSVIFGIGTICVGTGSYLMGNADAMMMAQSWVTGAGAILFGIGVRDALPN